MIIAPELIDTLWHRATFTPPDTTTVDDYNQPIRVDGTPVNDVPCRFRHASADDIAAAQTIGIQKVEHVVTTLHSFEMVPGMKITNLEDLSGNTVHDGSLTIHTTITRNLLDQPFFNIGYMVGKS